MKRLRISAISYLNTAPLMWDFDHGHVGSQFEINYTIPSLCAASLQAGTADIGIIPAAAYATIPSLSVIPGVAIASRRAVRSILLVCKAPLAEIKSVALDSSSMTSVALTKVLFAKWWGGTRDYAAMAPNVEQMLAEHDAALVIGDPALRIDRSRYLTYDLAEEWIRFTGKPFVFAFWAIRQAALRETEVSPDLASTFQRSRDHGLLPANVDQISRDWAPRLDLSQEQVRTYLVDHIHYQLDPACLEGLNLFYREAAECGALPVVSELTFLDTVKAAAALR